MFRLDQNDCSGWARICSIVSGVVKVPVVACGGAGTVEHLKQAIKEGGASAVAAGSMFVFHGRHRAVLINYPDEQIRKFI